MKYPAKIIPALFTLLCASSAHAQQPDSVILTTRNEFVKAKAPSATRYADNRPQKTGLKVTFPNCTREFIDDTSYGSFVKYNYVCDMDSRSRYKLMKETTYKGEGYCVVDTKNNCDLSKLLGKPYVFDSLVLSANESEVGDQKSVIEVWKMGATGMSKVAAFNMNELMAKGDWIGVEKFGMLGGRILFKDFNGRYWKLNRKF